MLITSLAGSGCLTTISQALGAGLEQRARRYAALIAGLAGLTGTVIAATSLLCLPLTLRLMHVSPEMEPWSGRLSLPTAANCRFITH